MADAQLPGQVVLLRNIARSDGTVTTAIPALTVQDTQDAHVVFIPKGTRYKNNWQVPPSERVAAVANSLPSAKRRYRNLTFRTDSLRLYLPGFGYSVGLSFDESGKFTSWYGNLEAPFVRTALGIDTRDYALDVVADETGSWRWKDEEEFARRLALDIDTAAHQARVREAGWDFIARLERRDWPFNADWQSWRVPKGWKPQPLPENWAADFGTHKLLSANALEGYRG